MIYCPIILSEIDVDIDNINQIVVGYQSIKKIRQNSAKGG